MVCMQLVLYVGSVYMFVTKYDHIRPTGSSLHIRPAPLIIVLELDGGDGLQNNVLDQKLIVASASRKATDQCENSPPLVCTDASKRLRMVN